MTIKLVRNGREETVGKIVRGMEQADMPDGFDGPRIPKLDDMGDWIEEPHFRGRVRRYVTGQIEYLPVRLAYASTVHKSQSLTLDKVQVDLRDFFFGKPAMAYVALSRCRSLAGLRIVCSRDKFAKQVSIDPRVLPWL
jgi:hypothetical protein